MDIVLQEKDCIDDLYYKGKPVLKQKHRLWNLDGRTIVQVGDMNTIPDDAKKLISYKEVEQC
jgi:hypothetical protein